jgi:hypothetical protein
LDRRLAAIEDEKEEGEKKYVPHKEFTQHSLNKTPEIEKGLHPTMIRSRTLRESLRTNGGELKENLDSFQMPVRSWFPPRPRRESTIALQSTLNFSWNSYQS